MADNNEFKDFAMINDYLIDVSVQEDHTYESEVTDYPVESGGSFSDNIRPKPITISMTGIVSDSPLADISRERAKNPLYVASGKESRMAYGVLVAIWREREPVTIRTSLGTYKNMALTSLSIPRSKDTGAALHFTAQFQQIQTVTSKRVRVAVPACRGKKAKGPLPASTRFIRTVIWRKGSPPGSNDIFFTEYLGYFKKDLTTTAGGAGIVLLCHADNDKTPLDSVELAAYNKDRGRDMWRTSHGLPLDPNPNAPDPTRPDLVQDSNGGIRARPSETPSPKRPTGDLSKRVQLKDGSGLDPLVNAFKRPFM